MSRLGKPNAKSRPIKVELPSSDTVFKILKSKHKLCSHTTFGQIGFSTDRTTYQRTYLKNVLNELTTRKNQGEHDLTLKY